MANPNRYSSSDVPDYQNYPSPTATDFGRPSFSSNGDTADSTSTSNTQARAAAVPLPGSDAGRWDDVARQIGSSLGRIVAATREQSATATDTAYEARERAYETFDTKVRPMVNDAQARAKDIFEQRVKPAVDDVTRQAREKFESAQAQMKAQLESTQRRVRETYDRTSVQVKQTVDQHPLETILAAGIAGLVVGLGLRYWRDNRAY